MIMKMKIFLTAIAAALVMCACTTAKDNVTLAYFKDLGVEGTLPPAGNNYLIRIQSDDDLIITVSSSQPEATAMYNVPLVNPATRGVTDNTSGGRLQSYVVDHQGNIQFPVLGMLHVGGMTTDEIARMIKTRVSENVKDAYVNVRLNSFGVNVMGEVRNPGRIVVGKEKITLLDVLAYAGDLTEYARRDNVLVVRTEDGVSTYHRLNLESSDIFSSPYFYMQQNDQVVVEPNQIKVDNSKYNQYSAFKLSQTSMWVSVASIVASLVIALCVK